MGEAPLYCLTGVTLDERTSVRRTHEIEHERDIALVDLLESNNFHPVGSHGGPYHLVLGVDDKHLTLDIRLASGEAHGKLMLSLTPFRRIIKDYFRLCESYFKAVGGAHSAGQIESLDMGRRGLHDEGSELLRERLKGKVDIDMDTARRLFTLICVLHLKG